MKDADTSHRFTLEDAGAICVTPFLRREQEAEQANRLAAARQARAERGVTWSGLGAAPVRSGRSAEQVRADAEASRRRAAAFAGSVRGRFLQSLQALEGAGQFGPAETARAAFRRGFADARQPASCVEIVCALAPLVRLEGSAARGACLALAELLTSALAMAAE
jgi:hypothetical protein